MHRKFCYFRRTKGWLIGRVIIVLVTEQKVGGKMISMCQVGGECAYHVSITFKAMVKYDIKFLDFGIKAFSYNRSGDYCRCVCRLRARRRTLASLWSGTKAILLASPRRRVRVKLWRSHPIHTIDQTTTEVPLPIYTVPVIAK